MTKRDDVVVALLTLADIIVIVAMYPLLPPRATETLAVYIFDAFVVAVMALGFYTRMRKSQQGSRRRIFILNNWYEILAMIPIVVFAAARSFTTHDDIIVVGIMFRALGILYVLRLFRFIRDNLRIFGGNRTLQVFINFFLALTITTFFFYAAEHSVRNSQINTMGDSLWWTIQTMSTATYGPMPTTYAGRIVGSITMIIGVGITGVFISTLAAGLTKSRTQKRSNQLGYETKQTIKSKIDQLEELSESDVQVLLSIIKSLHNSLQNSKTNL
jgi:voltage-gated potassium channel